MSNKLAAGPDFKEMRIEQVRQQKVFADLTELKIDGACLTWANGDLVSERGIVRNDRFPHIIACLKELDWEVQGEMAVPGKGMRVFDITASEGWPKANFWIFKVNRIGTQDFRSAPATEVRKVIEETMRKHRFAAHVLRIPRKFDSIDEGWDFVQKFDGEGLCLKNDHGTDYKVKWLKESKWAIVGFEPGSAKGAFLILNPTTGDVGKISALSQGHISDYNRLLAAKEKPYAEFEYMFLTKKSNVPFQPRLRRVFPESELKGAVAVAV